MKLSGFQDCNLADGKEVATGDVVVGECRAESAIGEMEREQEGVLNSADTGGSHLLCGLLVFSGQRRSYLTHRHRPAAVHVRHMQVDRSQADVDDRAARRHPPRERWRWQELGT